VQELPAHRRRRGVAVALLALALGGCVRAGDLPLPGRDVYTALRLPNVGAVPVRQDSFAGKVVLVSFFATWCFPCLAELPTLKKLQAQHAEAGFTVVLVGLDLEGARVLQPFADEYQLPFPVLVADDSMRTGDTAFGQVKALPTQFLLDREGRVLLAYQGVADAADLEKVVADAVLRR
jgi:thiol-disulfide isomerase/thioredoxin